MKNRRIVVVAFLLAAVMLLGVGYAALTDTLTITGKMIADPSASNDEFQQNIYFSKAVSDPTSETHISSEAHVEADNNQAYFGVVGMQEIGDSATFEFVIKNDSSWNAIITPIIDEVTNDAPDHDPVFDVEWSWEKGSVVQDANNVAAKGGELTVYITVTLKVKPDEAHEASYKLSFEAKNDGDAVANVNLGE